MFKELPHVYVEPHELKHAAQKYGRLFYHVSGRPCCRKNRATVSLYLRFHLASELFHVLLTPSFLFSTLLAFFSLTYLAILHPPLLCIWTILLSEKLLNCFIVSKDPSCLRAIPLSYLYPLSHPLFHSFMVHAQKYHGER